MASTSTIRPLPADVASQIKSSISITSLNNVVLELLKNSLDASSRRVDIVVEYGRGACTVEDDGLGIPPNEFREGGGLGKLHHTSKHNSSTPCYGSRGSFLASLAALSLISITSHHHSYNSHNTISINRSQVIARQIPAPLQHHISTFKHGTRVMVRDLFGNMPVRIKQRTMRSAGQPGNWREWEELRKVLTGLLLAWTTSVVLIVKDGASSQKMQLRGSKMADSSEKLDSELGFITHVCSLLSQADFISSAEKPSWISMHASTRKLSILGAVSFEPAPTKEVQFISFGINPLFSQYGRNILYEDINRLFRNSSFGSEDSIDDVDNKGKREKRGSEDRRCKSDGYANKELKIPRRGVDRWPKFVIKIQAFDLGISNFSNDTDGLMYDKNRNLSCVTELLYAMILEFLRAHNFRPKSTRSSARTRPNMGPLWRSQTDSSGASGPKGGLSTVTLTHSEWTKSPFNGWSRVKSGKRSHTTKDSTGPLDRTAHDLLLQRDGAKVLRCGKVIRQPFDDLPVPLSSSFVGRIADRHESSSLEVMDDSLGDGLVSWTNPITKEDTLVNSRTGFVVRPTKRGKQAASWKPLSIKGAGCQTPLNEASLQDNVGARRNKSSWISEVLRNWDNPVFHSIEPEILQISTDGICGEAHRIYYGRGGNFSQPEIDKALRELSSSLPGRLSKKALQQTEVIAQVDKKFVLTKICSNNMDPSNYDAIGSKGMLVIIDQHAADERCRIEALLRELCSKPQVNKLYLETPLMVPGVPTMGLEKPLSFDVSRREIQLLQIHMQHFARWGILYDLSQSSPQTVPRQQQKIIVKSLPPGIIERCKTDPRLLIELLRSEAWECAEKGQRRKDWSISPTNEDANSNEGPYEFKHAWVRPMHDCPQGILDLLNSRACRSAIMFNDELSKDQCKSLISRLAECAFPFQCAHGRPSMVPLVDLGLLGQRKSSDVDGNYQKSENFGRAFKKWRHRMSGISDT